MSQQHQGLIARLRAQRQAEIEVEEGLTLILTRPLEAELSAFSAGTGYDIAKRWVVGWRGMTEEHILGKSVGSPIAVDFSRALWEELISDKSAWCIKVHERLIEMINAYAEMKAKAQGNSSTSSTPSSTAAGSPTTTSTTTASAIDTTPGATSTSATS